MNRSKQNMIFPTTVWIFTTSCMGVGAPSHFVGHRHCLMVRKVRLRSKHQGGLLASAAWSTGVQSFMDYSNNVQTMFPLNIFKQCPMFPMIQWFVFTCVLTELVSLLLPIPSDFDLWREWTKVPRSSMEFLQPCLCQPLRHLLLAGEVIEPNCGRGSFGFDSGC